VNDRWTKAAFLIRASVVGTVQVSAFAAIVGLAGYWVFRGLKWYAKFLIAKSGSNGPGWFIASGLFVFFCVCAAHAHYASLVKQMESESKCDYVEKTHRWPFGHKP